jgi:hypothetical protein
MRLKVRRHDGALLSLVSVIYTAAHLQYEFFEMFPDGPVDRCPAVDAQNNFTISRKESLQ